MSVFKKTIFPVLAGIVFAGQGATGQEQTRSVTIIDETHGKPSLAAPERPRPLSVPKTPEAVPPSLEPSPVSPTQPPSPVDSKSALPDTGSEQVNTLDKRQSIRLANSAEISVEMLPGQDLPIGSRVSFRIISRKPGYVVLIDIDASGKLTQVYPNTASLARSRKPDGNYIKPGIALTIPNAADPYAGVEYVVSPPTGKAMIVAILSEKPVQILDLPDIPRELSGQDAALGFLTNWTAQLRIPDRATGQLVEANWSFDAKYYGIQ